MKLQRYNKMWAAMVPLIALVATEFFPEAGITQDGLTGWGQAVFAVITPILVWAVPNRDTA